MRKPKLFLLAAALGFLALGFDAHKTSAVTRYCPELPADCCQTAIVNGCRVCTILC